MSVKPAAATSEGRLDPFGLVGARLDTRYDVVDVVAQGGFGVVYRAQHRELRKPVAIKVLKTPAGLTPKQQMEFLQRFADEARTVAKLDHAHIVRVLDSGTSIMPSGAKAPWMALEWLEGTTLEADFNQRIESGSPGRTPAETIALMYPIIEAVGIAHEEGIVHRDIKPGNLMIVTGRRGQTRLKLLDFGIAKVMGAEARRSTDRAQTLTQVQAFSPDYAAPEQVSGMRTGPWTDVHALALLMSEMLTARIPYEGGDAMEMCASVLSPQRPTPGDRGVDVGPWEPVFARALALRPSDRYEDAAEFLAALMNALPPDVDERDADLWSSQTGTHRRTPSQSEPRSSSLPPPSTEVIPSHPTPDDGLPRLEVPRYTPSFAPPSSHPPPGEEDGRATTVMASVTVPPRATFRPGPPTQPPPPPLDDLAEFTLDEPVVDAPLTPFTPVASAPALTPSYPPLRASSSLRPPRRSPATGALLVALGLLFGGLVSGAGVLLLRGAFLARPTPAAGLLRPSPARPSPHPVTAPPPLPPVTIAPLPVVPAATVDAAVAPDAVDAAVVADDHPRRRSRHRSTHRSTHRIHRHRRDPAD